MEEIRLAPIDRLHPRSGVDLWMNRRSFGDPRCGWERQQQRWPQRRKFCVDPLWWNTSNCVYRLHWH